MPSQNFRPRRIPTVSICARFGKIPDDATPTALAAQKEKFPAELGEDEQVALETGLANGLRARLLAEIETVTCDFALPRLSAATVGNSQGACPEPSRGASRS